MMRPAFGLRLIAVCAVPLLVAGAVRLAAWQGLLLPVRVFGGSMADSLLGDHYRLACDDCGFPCRFDAHALPRARRVVCPNCGGVTEQSVGDPVLRGQRVRIDRMAYWWRRPRRWETIALRECGTDRLAVKRVVGLPGESVEIRDGDIYIDGQLARKSLAQMRDLALLVHDSQYIPRGLPGRWQPMIDTSGWRQRGSGLTFQPSETSRLEELDWLAYHHWPCFSGAAQRAEPSPVWDHYGYNQRVARQLHAVNDLMLVCQLSVSAESGQVAFEVANGGDGFRVVLDFEHGTSLLLRGSRRVTQRALPAAAYAPGATIELALCDGQVMFAIDRQLLFREQYAPGGPVDEPMAGVTPPVRIGARGVRATVNRLQVFRDIHYLDPLGTGRPWQAPQRLGPSEIFVLGDNVPISQDSRHRGPLQLSRVMGAVRASRRCSADALAARNPYFPCRSRLTSDSESQ